MAVDWGLLWGIVGAVAGLLALVGVPYSIVAYYRGNPKRRLEYWVESTRLVAAASESIKNLEIKVEGLDVRDPYLNTLALFSNSRADIPSSAFDAGKPILVKITRGGALHLEGADKSDEIKVAGGHGEGFEWAEYSIAPQLIRKKAGGKFIFVSSGPPALELDFPLIDIETRQLTPAQVQARQPFARRARRNAWLIFAAGPVVLLLVYGVTTLVRILSGT